MRLADLRPGWRTDFILRRFAFERGRVGTLYMTADPDDVPIGNFRSLGFADASRGAGLQRTAPQDRAAAGAGAATA